MIVAHKKPGAWVAMITNVDYLAACLVMAYSLRSVKSKYPLVVMVCDIPGEAREILELSGVEIVDADKLVSADSDHVQDKRFLESWTKLRAFDMIDYERIVLLDADMLVKQNMDELMDLPLEDGWIACTHACACNPRNFPHYPADWIPENCAYTNKIHPPPITSDSPRAYNLLNGGLVVLKPSRGQFEELYTFLKESPLVASFMFPDQDLMAVVYKGRWKPLPYIYNALKTLVVVHPNLWVDDNVKCIHYILTDKPWLSRPKAGSPYYTVNGWWWEAYDGCIRELNSGDAEAHKGAVKYLQALVAKD
ncbi:nucleotide-diphospho-sugar transferase [Schizopora paradoxa]|uniref:Nucleotide-diphospho-sugar transferase n=1 Tax=Schizopora paradoxa TaxID=27342 RepID=A0A0H2RDN9_9AGAM|nr:nucleotide-diphospho-sugar transferase [Schizopora paradoxa]